jgi:hypothetical protein
MDSGVPRGSTRDNGLRCANYAPIADLDPRVVDSLLSTLRDAGIAAYAVPAAGTVGGAMELRMPPRPVDRLWVDDQQVARARGIVADEQREEPREEPRDVTTVGGAGGAGPAATQPAGADSVDLDAAWQQVLASLQSPSSSPVPPWPVREDVDRDDAAEPPADGADDTDEAGDDEHFVPPPPPPFPRPQPATLGAMLSIAAGLAVLALQLDGGSLTALAILAILGGVASQVWLMRNGPPTDSGWDDGAVL